MKERMPPIEVLKKPIEDRLLEPVNRVTSFFEEHGERSRKEVLKRMGGAMQRLAKEPTIAAALFMGGLLSSIPAPSRVSVSDPAYGETEGMTKGSFDSKREDLARILGEDLVDQQIPVTSADRDPARRRVRREQERSAGAPAMEGFEDQLGIRHETLEQLVLDGYPRGFGGQDAVERMRYTLERIPLPRSYGIHGYEAGHCTVAPGSDASEIVVTVDGVAQDTVYRAREQVTGAFGPLLTHELAHASDWQNAAGISPEVRLNLLHRVVRRLESGQAIPYAYVTNIRNPDRNLQRERLSKAKEYFAELMSDAFQASAETFQTTRDPARALATAFALRHGGRAERYLPDARIVVEYVHELDPSFHWEKAAHAREKTLNQLARERGRFLVERAISRLRSPVLVDELMQAFRRTYREALHETPVVLFGQAEEGDPKDDELLDDVIKERLGLSAVQRFAELRARLREDWQSDLDRVVRESRVELQGALSPWQDMAQMVGVPNDYADFADSGTHLDIASIVESLNQVLDGFRHEPELRRSFEERAQQLLALASGHIMLTTEDMAELRRYERALARPEREQVRLASR